MPDALWSYGPTLPEPRPRGMSQRLDDILIRNAVVRWWRVRRAEKQENR